MGPSQTNPNFTTFQRDIIHNLTFLKRILFLLYLKMTSARDTKLHRKLELQTEKSDSSLNNDEDNKIKKGWNPIRLPRDLPIFFPVGFFVGSIYFISASKFAAYYNQFSLKKKVEAEKRKKRSRRTDGTWTDCGAFFHTFRIKSGSIRAELTDGQGRGENVSIFQFNINHCFLVLLIVRLNLFPATASLDHKCCEHHEMFQILLENSTIKNILFQILPNITRNCVNLYYCMWNFNFHVHCGKIE